MIAYADFIVQWPAYANLPYTQPFVESQLAIIAALYPSIEDCLPESVRVVAAGFAFKHMELQDDCDAQVGLVSVSSMNDKYVYRQGKTPFALNTTLWGSRLSNLFTTYGCYISATPSSRPESCCAGSDHV
jgi:hypothetical protein